MVRDGAVRLLTMRGIDIACPRMAANLKFTQIYSRRKSGTRLRSQLSASYRLALTFGVWQLCFAQPLGSLSRPMRNKITKLLIVVVPRRTAGDG